MVISIPTDYKIQDFTTENCESLAKTISSKSMSMSMSMCGISSSQVFFFLAAVTGCISVIVNMNSTDDPVDSGGIRAFNFGAVCVVEPKGKHQATIVWLHGLGDDGSRFNTLQIKWICPTSPVQPLTFFGGISTTAWFDVIGISEDASQDVQGLDASAAYVLSLLSTELPNIKLGVGGFSMGAATAIYSAICFACGKFGNGTGCPAHLDAVLGLSGWLPCARALSKEVEGRAYLPILLCHGKGSIIVSTLERWLRSPHG